MLLTVFLGSFSSFNSIVVMCLVAVSSSCDRAAKILFVCIIILSICYVCHSVNIHLSPHDIPICHIYLSIYLSVLHLSICSTVILRTQLNNKIFFPILKTFFKYLCFPSRELSHIPPPSSSILCTLRILWWIILFYLRLIKDLLVGGEMRD